MPHVNKNILLPANEVVGGHVFTYVCLSVHKGIHVAITYVTLDLSVEGPPPHPRQASGKHPT